MRDCVIVGWRNDGSGARVCVVTPEFRYELLRMGDEEVHLRSWRWWRPGKTVTELATAILAEVLGGPEQVPSGHAQQFAERVLLRLDRDVWSLSSAWIRNWCHARDIEAKVKLLCAS